MKSIGSLCIFLVVLLSTQLLCVSSKKTTASSITDVKTKGDCSQSTLSQIVQPCIGMVSQITVGGIKNDASTSNPAVRIKGIFAIALEALFLNDDVDLEKIFESICGDINKIDTCLKNTAADSACRSKSGLTAFIENIRNSYPVIGTGKKASCNPANGKVSGSVNKILKNKDAMKCMRDVGKNMYLVQLAVFRAINRLKDVVVNNVDLTKTTTAAGKKAYKDAQTNCKQINSLSVQLNIVKSCSKECSKKNSVKYIKEIFTMFLGVPDLKECKKAKKPKGKKYQNIGIYGCGHIQNSAIAESGYQTVNLQGSHSGCKTSKFNMELTFVKANVSESKVCTPVSEIKLELYGDQKYCGKKGYKSKKTIIIGDPDKFKASGKIKVKCDKKNHITYEMKLKKKNNKNVAILKVFDQCERMNFFVRCRRFTNSKNFTFNVCYLTLRTAYGKDEQSSGILFTGSQNTVNIANRRRKRAVSPEMASAASYDASSTGVSEMKNAMEDVNSDQADLEADDALLGGSIMVTANTALIMAASFVAILRW